ncbi:MAG: hypothetical protein RLZZ630_2270 [Bacteroidota bacterium]|jgi:hypothetical protein
MSLRIKKSIATREIKEYVLREDLVHTYTPKPGDVGVFEVMVLGRHESIQSDNKRNVTIFPGDVIIACFANRYATSQFEGYVPEVPTEMVHILGAGGAIGIVKTKNQSLRDVEPTLIRLIGYCCGQDGQVLNTIYYHTPKVSFTGKLPFPTQIILSIGSTMDSGKTTTAAYTARGLKATGKKVGYIKYTGTSYTKDKDFVYDCGADITMDFSDMGYPSTYMTGFSDLLDLYQTLLEAMKSESPDYIVMEIADGLLQRETSFLLKHKPFMDTIHKVIFSCGDSLSAFQGVELLNEMGIRPTLLSGRFSMSPLLIQEVRSVIHDIPIRTIYELMNGAYNHEVLGTVSSEG